MRLLFLDTIETVILDVIAWALFHLGIGYYSSTISPERFNPDNRMYQPRKWEKEGGIYDKIFKVRSWKKLIPNGSALYSSGYSIKNLRSSQIGELDRWLRESCRAEFCHWMMIIPGFFFFLWNSVEAGWAMVMYAIINNLIPILMQRYNRPRARKLITLVRKRTEYETGRMTSQDEIYLNPLC